MGSAGSYDNALAEALNSLYKAELIDNEACPGYAGPWCDRREVERETTAWVHWYNTRRLYFSLGGITPLQAENQRTTTRKEAASTSLHKNRDLANSARAAVPVTRRCTRYVAIHPNRRGVMPTDRVQRTQSQEQTRNLRGDRRRIRTLTRYCERGQPRPRAD